MTFRVDTQGLLDRVFPLPADSSISQPKPHSLRTLLKESSQHSLSILRVSQCCHRFTGVLTSNHANDPNSVLFTTFFQSPHILVPGRRRRQRNSFGFAILHCRCFTKHLSTPSHCLTSRPSFHFHQNPKPTPTSTAIQKYPRQSHHPPPPFGGADML